jgi:hypothetical protein
MSLDREKNATREEFSLQCGYMAVRDAAISILKIADIIIALILNRAFLRTSDQTRALPGSACQNITRTRED